MEYVLAVYRSRNVSMQAYNYLLRNGVTCALVSTPRAANVGCGLSVKFSMGVLQNVRQVLSRGETFVGFFVARTTYGGVTLSRI